MKLVITVQDARKFRHLSGLVVMGGNAELDQREPREIKTWLTGKEVEIATPDGSTFRTTPSTVEVSASLMGERIVALLIPTSSDVPAGSTVHLIDDG